MYKKIYLSSPHMSREGFEQDYINEAFASNFIAPAGANVDGFERAISEYTRTPHVAAISSGTAAIHLALKAAGVTRGDVVLCQSHTFVASY